MKILLFGGSGYIGRNISEYLINIGYDTTLYLRKKSIYKISDLDWYRAGKYIFGDFSFENDFENMVSDYDIIIHMVSATVPSVTEPINDIDAVIKPTIKLVEACAKKDKRIIFFSSGGAVYGSTKNVPISENEYLNPISAYGIHKVIIEQYMLLYKQLYGLRCTIIRPSNPYGRKQFQDVKQGLIPNLLGNYFNGAVTRIFGTGESIRDYIYIDDLVSAVGKIISYSGEKSIFNIGLGKGYSINEVIKIVEECLNDTLQVTRVNVRKQDVSSNILNIQEISLACDWKPKIDLKEGILKTLEYWEK